MVNMGKWSVISGMFLRIYYNAILNRLKKDPILILTIFIVLGLAGGFSWYCYRHFYDFFSTYGEIGASSAFVDMILGNIFSSTFSIIFIVNLLFLQAETHDKKMVDLLRSLPVTKKDILIASYLPHLMLILIFLALVAAPLFLAIGDLLHFSPGQNAIALTAYSLFLFTAVTLAIALSKLIRELSGLLLGRASKTVVSMANVFFILLFVFGAIQALIYSAEGKTPDLARLMPAWWMQKSLAALYYQSTADLFVGLFMLLCYFVLSLILVALTLSLDIGGKGAETQFRPLRRLPFVRSRLANMSLLEIKLTTRDFELLAYVILISFFLLGLGLIVKSTEKLPSLVPLYASTISYGVGYLFSFLPLVSRGKSKEYDSLLFSTPLKIFHFVMGKVTLHVMLISFLGVGLLSLVLAILGVRVEGSTLIQIPFFALSATLAYLIGSTIMIDQKNISSQIIGSSVFILALTLIIGWLISVEGWIEKNISPPFAAGLENGFYAVVIVAIALSAYLIEVVRKKYAGN